MSSAGNAIYSAAALFRLVKAIVKEAHTEREGEEEKMKRSKSRAQIRSPWASARVREGKQKR